MQANLEGRDILLDKLMSRRRHSAVTFTKRLWHGMELPRVPVQVLCAHHLLSLFSSAARRAITALSMLAVPPSRRHFYADCVFMSHPPVPETERPSSYVTSPAGPLTSISSITTITTTHTEIAFLCHTPLFQKLSDHHLKLRDFTSRTLNHRHHHRHRVAGL